ncbi:MAG: ferrous iron transport protein B [Oscillospiraceae bacterium]|nr:ferrous iron transport protein B [Oscillospiraceae bacterium]
MGLTTIALVGNPNSGKTTLFNILTKSSQYVGNWPGVTVEKKEGRLRRGSTYNTDAVIVDLPGVYSLSPYSLEEVITRDYLINNRPDVILNIVDASNLERNLYLTTQLLEIGIPVVVALNMMDMVAKNKDILNADVLSAQLGCPVAEVSAVKGIGVVEAAKLALAQAKMAPPTPIKFNNAVEYALSQIEALVKKNSNTKKSARYYAIKLFERDKKIISNFSFSGIVRDKIEHIVKVCEAELDDDGESIITNQRYECITEIACTSLKKGHREVTMSDRIDSIATNKWLALPIFVLIMFVVYYVSIGSLGGFLTEWTSNTLFGTWLSGGVSGLLEAFEVAAWLQSLILDGIIGGVGAVLGFVPQMMILFFFLSVLEDCGYMARVAFIMDRIFKIFGLSGKSFIPLLISTGCGVPGIMASRTIESENERKMTVMVATFVPCSAKLPVIALITGSLFSKSAWWIAPSVYFLGIFAVALSGIILKKTHLFDNDTSPFIMELPKYQIPSLKSVMVHIWERSRAFIIKAGTVIFLACGIIWFLSSYGWDLKEAGQDGSMLADIGRMISPVFAPVGFGDWRAAVATLTGIAAKENVVGSLAVLLGHSADSSEMLFESVAGMFTPISAYAFLAFNMLCAPCIAAIAAIHREMVTIKWTLITISYQTLLAYAVSFLIYQLGSVIFLGAPVSIGTFTAILVLAFMLWLALRPDKRAQRVGIKL